MTYVTEGPFRLDRCPDWRPFRDALARAGYTRESVAQLLGNSELGSRLDCRVALRRAASRDPFDTLTRLFFLGQEEEKASVKAALSPVPLELFVDVGLLTQSNGRVSSQAVVVPYEEFLVVHDVDPWLVGKSMRADHVVGVGRAAMNLAQLTVRHQIELGLDVGVGSGFQLLLASRHTGRLVGTDINQRALNFAAFTGQLNGLRNLELLEGNLFEPIQARRFDLILANPPFVISPESRYAFRDGGLPGDRLSRQVVEAAGAHLNEGGFATVIFDWAHEREHDWDEPLRQWVQDSGCDVWLLRMKTRDALAYAAQWIKETHEPGPVQFDELLGNWLADYERHGIRFVSHGAAILRRRADGPHWLRRDSVGENWQTGSCSEQILRIFAGQDLLTRDDSRERMLQMPLALAPEHELMQTLQATEGGWDLKTVRLRLKHGFEFVANLNPLAAALLEGCNGRQPLRAVIQELAKRRGQRVEQLAPACLGAVRTLIAAGFVTGPFVHPRGSLAGR